MQGEFYGTEVTDKWLHGIVIEVMSQRRNANSKRATTYVKANYRCGDAFKIAILPLQVLKERNPSVPVAAPVNNVPASLNEDEANNPTAVDNEPGPPQQ